jgi:hypothetical protein
MASSWNPLPLCQARPIVPHMDTLAMMIGPLRFRIRLETEKAPRTCAAVCGLLPIEAKAIQARWSGEAAWAPIDDIPLQVEFENATSHPAPGELLLYPGGYSEREILLPYGGTCFASKLGQLAGNHFATVIDGNEQLVEMGRLVLWEGAQPLVIREG